MKAVQLLVNSVLPEDLRNYDQTYDVKSLNKIMNAVGKKYPEQFDDILHKIANIGRKASYYQGETITLDDLENVIDKDALFAEMDKEIAALPKDKNFIRKRREIFQKYNELMEKETGKAALANRNNLAMAILSGARGKSPQLKAMVTSPGTYSDYKGEPIDVFSRTSFAEGLSPTAFAASTYGSRAAVVSTKCLDYQSLTKMADLSEKRLCDIKVGDMVLGADKEGNVFPVKVLNVFDQGEKECRKYVFKRSILEDDSSDPVCTVVCTKDHKFLNAKQGCSLPIEEAHKRNYMRPGVKWKLSDGSVVVAVEAEPVGKVHCMDIEVDHPDHLFVLANGLITSNSSTAKGGDLAKQMAQSTVDMVVREKDCGTHNGLVYGIDESTLKGRVLARETAGIPADTLIDREVLQKLRKAGVEEVEARSPLTCSVKHGLCSRCIGKYYNGGKWAPVGTHVGAIASTSSSEPVCLVKGTEVRMADGSVKKIEDIEPGEYVLGSDMNGYCKPTKVVNKFHNGPRNCYRSYIKKGYGLTSGYITLDSTAEHKILGTVRAINKPLHKAELNISAIGTMPACERTVRMCQSITGSEGGEVHEPMAMLLGMLVGDGSYKGTASGSAKHAVRLSCYDDEQVEVLRKELEPLGLLVKSYTTPNEYRIVEADQYNTDNWTSVQGITHSDRTKIRNRVRAKLIEEGMWGQDCYTKTLPKSIWSWDTESVCKFVGGLIATDGYVTKTGIIGYSSNSVELLKQIKELLQFRLGVYSTNIISSRKKKPDGTYYNPTYSFTINEANSVLRFAEMIDIPGRKAALLAAANRKSNYKRRGLYKLEKQEWLGMQDTWDLEVDNDTHLFALANGLIVSNTQMALCLHANTQVVMADGGFKKIKDIIPGDIVIGADRKGNQKSVEVLSKFRQGTKKVRVYAAEAYADYSTEDPFSLVPQDYSTLLHVTCTPEHKMLMADGSIRPIDDCITCAEENLFLNTIYGKAKIVSSSELMDAPCYDIEVDHPDHLFLLANGMITSNSAKHTAGMTQSKKTYSGLDALIQFTQSPEKFKDQGAVSELDGKVENIEEAPQGGMLVTIAGKKHYVPQGHEVEVKVGDKVEAGDQLAEGLVDAEDIVRLKGLGEGRKYYAERLNKMLADSGAATDQRNTEIIARGALRHVRVTNDEGMGDYLPDDVIDYNALQGSYRPSETSQTMAPDAAVGKYLQTPVMHYTIGTRITPKVAANLKKHNHNEIDVDDVEPGFKAEMIRLRASSHTNPDWLASLGTSYLGKQLNEASTKGDDTNVLENVDYRPRLAFGKDFGRKADQTGIF